MQIIGRGGQGTNPTVGGHPCVYSLHLTHVGEKASVNNTSSVTHAALSYYVAGGGCT